MNFFTTAQVLLFIKRHPLTVAVAVLACIPYVILKLHGLVALELWFMPASFGDFVNPLMLIRLWSPSFVHYELLHLATNVYLWLLMASKLEKESRGHLIALFLICAAFGNVSQYMIAGPNFGGLSGVVYGLLGYLWVQQVFAGRKDFRLDPILCWVLLALIPVAATGMFGKYANAAHITGLLCGALLALPYVLYYRKDH
ncbi:MAG: GlpG protein [Flavobacteriales bacterium]|jgi:GlpG protein